MIRKILLRIIEWLYRRTYEQVTLDKVNQKLIRPVPGLIIDGVQYWEFVQIADMPESRRTHYSYLRDEMVMGVDRELLLKYVEELKKANAGHDVNRIGSLLFMLEDTLANVTTIESLYNLASLVYFDPREDLKGYDYDYARQKIERFKALPDKNFFFEILFQQTLKLSSQSLPRDIRQFLRENEVKLNAYKRMLFAQTGSIA